MSTKLVVQVYLFNPRNVRSFWNKNAVEQAFRQYFPVTENGISIELSVAIQTKVKDFKDSLSNTPTNDTPNEYVHVMCQGILRPGYVKENFDVIEKNGGVFVKCYAEVGARRNMKTYHLGFTTCYIRNSDNSYDVINDFNDLSLYIATICSPSNVPIVTIKGLGSRLLDSIYSMCVGHTNFKSVRLEALLYCVNPNQILTINDQQMDVDVCNLWLHDYYMSKGYQLLNNHIYNESNELFEYERDTVENKLKKKSSGHKMYKFNTMALVPMIKTIR
jgi:hypothetical protein